MSKIKIFFIIIGIILVMCLSIFFTIFSLRNMVDEGDDEIITETTVVIENLNDIEQIDNVIEKQLEEKNSITNRFAILNRYSIKYVSVAEWMLEEICTAMNENGFTVEIEDEELGWITVDGLTVYPNAETYLTECLNNDLDIDDLFYYYCPNLYEELDKTFLLGEDTNNEYGEYNSNSLYQTYLGYYYDGNYQNIITDVEKLIKTYKFTMPYNYKICNIYQDAKASLAYGAKIEAISYGLPYMLSPETYLSNFLKLTDKEKLSLIVDFNSVIPFSNTIATYISSETLSEDDKNIFKSKYSNLIYDTTDIIKVSFYILNPSLTYDAYIYSDMSTYQVIKLEYTGDGDCMYRTARELNNLYYPSNYLPTEEPSVEQTETIEEIESSEEINTIENTTETTNNSNIDVTKINNLETTNNN